MLFRSRELLVAVAVAESAEVGGAAAAVHDVCRGLGERGVVARATAFTAGEAGANVVRLADEQEVDLILVDAPPAVLEHHGLGALLAGAPCDVAVLVGRAGDFVPGPLLVPFAGAEHDWTAIELAAWIARSGNLPLRLTGPAGEREDASRLLANASIAVQRALGVTAEPALVPPGVDAIVRAAETASLVVVGLADSWRRDGLGVVRSALAAEARPPVLLVRRGLRPGGLAPPDSRTRFTWTIRPA